MLKAYKNKLKEDFSQFGELVNQISNITENESITEKLEFIQSSSDTILDLYQALFNTSKKYLN